MDWLLVALIVTVNIACFRFGLWYGFKKLTDGHERTISGSIKRRKPVNGGSEFSSQFFLCQKYRGV